MELKDIIKADIIISTPHKEYASLKFSDNKPENKIVIDIWNIMGK